MPELIDTYFSKCAGGGELLAHLMESAREGHLCLETAQEPPQFAGVVRDGSRLYLKRNWVFETRVLEQLKRLCRPLGEVPYDDPELNVEQSAALKKALTHSVSIIAGGPGTGKTFIARHLMRAIGPGKRVVLTAPTGKAAARLKLLNPDAVCGTLHSVLQIRSEHDLLGESSYLSADLILVDESSMIDVQLLGYFLASISAGGRIVFLGDADQLPPVESGTVFADLVDLIPTARLSRCMRSDRAEVLNLAKTVLEGRPIETFPMSLEEGFFPTEFSGPEMFDGFRYLSCVRQGIWGVNNVNEVLFERFYRRLKAGQELPVPILITKNDPKKGFYNGDTGVAIFTTEGFKHAFFPGDRKAIALPPYEKAYCISVHKSQGSEFGQVVVLVPPGSEVFGREVIYTGVTRAKYAASVAGDSGTVSETLRRSSRKISGLKQRWTTCAS